VRAERHHERLRPRRNADQRELVRGRRRTPGLEEATPDPRPNLTLVKVKRLEKPMRVGSL
jgi:hypothetical protein